MATTTEKDPLAEMHRLVEAMHEDRAEQKRKEAAERWTRGVSLWVIFLAVGGAMIGQQQTSFSGKAVRSLNQAAIEQGQATNQWSYYQAVSVKAHLYLFQQELVSKLAPKAPKAAASPGAAIEAGASPSAARTAEAKLARDDAMKKRAQEKLAKYDKQKKEILESARGFDKTRDENRVVADADAKTSRALGFAMAILQVAVALASTAILSKRKPIYFVSVGAGALGLLQAANAFWGLI